MNRIAIGFGVTILSATPATASDWWLVYTNGEKPSREVHYLDAASLDIVRDPSRLITTDFNKKLSDTDLVDYVRLEGVTVHESAKAPAKVAFQYRVKCDKRLVAKTQGSQLWRDGNIEQLPDNDWAPIDGNLLLSQVHAFVCEAGQRDSNGMLRVTNDEPTRVTWATFWIDGVEPNWTSTRTAEEINAEIDAKIASTREILARGAAMAGARLEKLEIDRALTIREQQKLFSQMGQKASPVLHSWIGLPERELVASWGVPHQSFESSGSRFLYYGYGYTTSLVNRYGVETPQETWACHMTFEVRDGLVTDYRSNGNYCQTAAANLPYGHPRE
jgi:hypothetical protein